MQFGASPLRRKKHRAWLETELLETSPALAGIAVLKRRKGGKRAQKLHIAAAVGGRHPEKSPFGTPLDQCQEAIKINTHAESAALPPKHTLNHTLRNPEEMAGRKLKSGQNILQVYGEEM